MDETNSTGGTEAISEVTLAMNALAAFTARLKAKESRIEPTTDFFQGLNDPPALIPALPPSNLSRIAAKAGDEDTLPEASVEADDETARVDTDGDYSDGSGIGGESDESDEYDKGSGEADMFDVKQTRIKMSRGIMTVKDMLYSVDDHIENFQNMSNEPHKCRGLLKEPTLEQWQAVLPSPSRPAPSRPAPFQDS